MPVGHPGVYKRGLIPVTTKVKEELGIHFKSLKETVEDLGEVLFSMYEKENK